MNFYRDSASIIEQIDAKKGSIKSCLGAVDEKQRKRTSALVIETLKYRPSLNEVMKASDLLIAEKRHLSPILALVLVHDLLLTKGGIQARDGPIKQAVHRHKTRLQAEWIKLKIKRGARSNTDMAQQDSREALHPRFARINANRWSLADAIRTFTELGFLEGDPGQPLAKDAYRIDDQIPNLLHFASSKSFQDDASYLQGKIILQDKASCFPSAVLAPPPNSTVIDATSAPGNKTSHLSALMNNTGKIFAFERDRRRFNTLETMLAKAGCKNVHTRLADFLTVDPQDARYKDVSHILLDPSCSGSGIVNRLDYLVDAENDDEGKDERLQKLSLFQLEMITHAMKFPGVQKIVYSTCSIHPQENEHVVRAALNSPMGKSAFELAPRSIVLPTWPRRGDAGELGVDGAEGLVRCSPEDGTNGFFVACFIRQGIRGDRAGNVKRKVQEVEGESTGKDAGQDVKDEEPRPKAKRQRRQKNTRPLDLKCDWEGISR